MCYIDSNNAPNDCASLLQTCTLSTGWWKIQSKQSLFLSETITNSDMLHKFPLTKYFITNVWLLDLRSNQLPITDHLPIRVLDDRLVWVFCSVMRITCTVKFLPEFHGCSIIFRYAGCTRKMEEMLEPNSVRVWNQMISQGPVLDWTALQPVLFWSKFWGLWSLVSLGFYKDCTLEGSSIQYSVYHKLLGIFLPVWQVNFGFSQLLGCKMVGKHKF